VHNLPEKELKKREVEIIDITSPVPEKDYKEDEDPTKFHSEKTGRGPLEEGWIEKADPVMCAYKLVTVEFKWWGLQTRVENFMMSVRPASLLCPSDILILLLCRWKPISF